MLILSVDAIYLDHAGTTLYSKSLMEMFTADMMANLYGNPHSASASSQLSTNRIEDIRVKVLGFFCADPEDFDLVFVANATAGIKLVMDAFRDIEGGFNYGYHRDSHTSLVGVRETAKFNRCMRDEDIEHWLLASNAMIDTQRVSSINLFAYPAQSNMDGRRLPLSWPEQIRAINASSQSKTYTLLDASALVSTGQLNLKDARSAPDFTVLSFYKIFGFPDLGALIVRKESGAILRERKYFGGGTVDVVLCVKEQWHAPKSEALHECLEDGTLQFHSILALDAAIKSHKKLYSSMDTIARHTAYLARRLYNGLSSLRHANSDPVCVIHSRGFDLNSDIHMQGPIVTFNVRNGSGAWVSNFEFEKLASVRKFHVRSGGVCNPGGVAACLNLEPWEMRKNFSAGFRCGTETDIYAGKITGVIRASVGAMTTTSDVESFVSFVQEFYAEKSLPRTVSTPMLRQSSANFVVESLTIYPIKSCGGFKIHPGVSWEVRPEGLAWDREWCLVHKGTGQALSQKRHPRMVLIRPAINFQCGFMRVSYHGPLPTGVIDEISVPLSANPEFYGPSNNKNSFYPRVCGDTIIAHTYAKPEIAEFFSTVLGVPCALARFPAGGSGFSTRHSKAHMQAHQRSQKTYIHQDQIRGACSKPPTPPDSDSEARNRPILLSNESPILAINKSSINALNDEIRKAGGKSAAAAVFRANIVLASPDGADQQPYCEDQWNSIYIGQQQFQMLGSCRRCHMICIDQDTAEKDEEPFVTLSKTRRFESKIFFGSHMCHVPSKAVTKEGQFPTIKVGDVVKIGADEQD